MAWLQHALLWAVGAAMIMASPAVTTQGGQLPEAAVVIGNWHGVLPVAATAAARHQGLMNQSDLADTPHPGMIFLFPPNHVPVFWMADTPEPLNLLFVSQGKVVDKVYMPPCNAQPCPLYPAPYPVRMAVELAPEIPVAEGDQVTVLTQLEGN